MFEAIMGTVGMLCVGMVGYWAKKTDDKLAEHEAKEHEIVERLTRIETKVDMLITDKK